MQKAPAPNAADQDTQDVANDSPLESELQKPDVETSPPLALEP